MNNLKIHIATVCIWLAASGIIAACGMLPSLPGPAAVDAGPTPTPLPTSTSDQYPTVDDRSCLVAELIPIRVENPQGDLLAWQPDSDSLAYVGPASNSNWFAGKLHMSAGPDFKTPADLAPEATVFGDLTWSPSGDQLAFTALRISDGVYTVMTVPAEGGPAQDWLPGEAAHTDDGNSEKVIVGWQPGGGLRILSSCGPDCDQILQIDLGSGQVSPVGEQIRKDHERLFPHTNLTTYDEETYPYMLSPNWSPDLSKIVYFDEDDRALVLLVDQEKQFILDIPTITIPYEAKWASDNRTLAVRTDDVIYIFDTECK